MDMCGFISPVKGLQMDEDGDRKLLRGNIKGKGVSG
jgi:hypothetical protein